MTEVIVPLAQVIVSPDDVDELGWQDQALCAQTDPEAFFPEKGGSTREAKRVCRSCEVRAECLEYALENDERFGIWGGMSERERRRLKREAVLSPGRRSSQALNGSAWSADRAGGWTSRVHTAEHLGAVYL
jgi:WhiB family redox-sensing transcriptional regulator